MFSTHRAWASGYRASFNPPHQGGVVEGWIGGEPLAAMPAVTTSLWTNVKLIPHFVQPNVFVRLTCDGQSVPPQALYVSPVLSHVTLTTSTPGWPTELGRFSFDYQQEDVVINFVESNGVSLANGQKEIPLIPMGGVWSINPIQQMAVVFPQLASSGGISVGVRVKPTPNWVRLWPKSWPKPPSLHLWIKQNGLKITHNGRSWESNDSEKTQHPFCKVHWSVAIAQ